MWLGVRTLGLVGSGSWWSVPVRAAVLWVGMFLGAVVAVVVGSAVGPWEGVPREEVPVVGSAARWTWWLAPGVVLPLAFVRSGSRGTAVTAGMLGMLFGLTLFVFGWNEDAEVSFALALWWPFGFIAGLIILSRRLRRSDGSDGVVRG